MVIKFSWSYVHSEAKIKKPETVKTYSLFIWGFCSGPQKMCMKCGKIINRKKNQDFCFTSASAVIDIFTVWALALTILLSLSISSLKSSIKASSMLQLEFIVCLKKAWPL
jgi:hypothetical protein